MKINKEEDQLLRQIAARIAPINVHSCEKHHLKGSEILEWESVTKIDGEPIVPEKMYVWRYPVITEMNHYRRLKNIWKDRDADRKMKGVLAYMKYIETVVARNMKEQNIPIPEPVKEIPTQSEIISKKKTNALKRFFKLLNGRIRLLFGVCPQCNSDAPELYDCKVCNWYRTSESGMPSRELKATWWRNFLSIT
jgi:hypothetical protein